MAFPKGRTFLVLAIQHGEESVQLFNAAGQPTDLHLIAGIDHFGFDDENPDIAGIVTNWLRRHIPAG